MARIDPLLGTAPVARIAGPHQSTVAAILRAVELGLFTAAQADMMIDRVRAHLTVPPITASAASLSSAADGFPTVRQSTPMATRGDETVTAILPSVSTDRPPLAVTAHPAPPAAIVLTVYGEVDMATSAQLTDHLLPHVRGTVPHVIIDLTDVDFLAAAGLTVLVNIRQAAVAADITLRLVASTRPVLLPLTITGLDGMFDISPDLTHALLRAGCGPDG